MLAFCSAVSAGERGEGGSGTTLASDSSFGSCRNDSTQRSEFLRLKERLSFSPSAVERDAVEEWLDSRCACAMLRTLLLDTMEM